MTTGTISNPPTTPGLEYKATTAAPESGLIGTDDETGVVEAIVSVTGVQDHDNDIIEPGAYKETLSKRRPKGIFSHDWGRWASRTETIEELMPGDPRLSQYAAKMGKQWPVKAGGLYVRTRYNLATQNGRDAYNDVKFFSETDECEWSVGYRVPSGKGVRGKDGVRRIREMDLYEYSPVLFGSASLSGTLSVKAVATEDPPSTEQDSPADEPEEAPDVTEVAPDTADEEGDALGSLDEATEQVDQADVEAAQPPSENEPDTAGDDEGDSGGEGEGDDPDSADEKAIDELEAKREFSGQHREQLAKEGTALPDGSFPIKTVGDLKNAISAYGRANPGRRAQVRRHIMKRARAIGHPELIPDSWKSGDDSKTTGSVQVKLTHEPLNRSPKKNWVEMAGQLPAYIQHIAKDLHEEKGMPLERAIPTAIAAVKRWCAGGGNVSADTHAKACKAVAEWEALKAKSHARSGAKTCPECGHDEPDAPAFHVKGLPHLPGTYEEMRERLHEAADAALADGEHLVEVLATWPDKAVVACYPLGGQHKTLSYEMPYSYDGEAVTLGDPAAVNITVDAGGETTSGEDLIPQPALIEHTTSTLKALLAADRENKAGRVLSGVNVNRLKAAVEQLVSVLTAAGVELKTPDEKEPEDQAPVETDSTAPSLRSDAIPAGKALIEPALHARAYRILGDVHART